MAVVAMAEIGIDIAGQREKSVAEYLGRVHFGYLITVCDQAVADCPIFPGIAERLHWSLDDPAAGGGSEEDRLAAFRRIRDELVKLVEEFVGER